MAMSSNESRAYELMSALGVDYVLVIFCGVTGYSGDDINKFLWMVRIAQGVHFRNTCFSHIPQHISPHAGEHPHDTVESDYLTATGEYKVDAAVSPR